MDIEKKPGEKPEQPKQDIAQIVGDLVVSGATVLAHSAAEAMVKRVRKAAAKTAQVKAVAKVVNRIRPRSQSLPPKRRRKGRRELPRNPARRRRQERRLRKIV
jgi:hypothetical protein